jgi:hypothetical protein
MSESDNNKLLLDLKEELKEEIEDNENKKIEVEEEQKDNENENNENKEIEVEEEKKDNEKEKKEDQKLYNEFNKITGEIDKNPQYNTNVFSSQLTKLMKNNYKTGYGEIKLVGMNNEEMKQEFILVPVRDNNGKITDYKIKFEQTDKTNTDKENPIVGGKSKKYRKQNKKKQTKKKDKKRNKK